MSQSTPSSEPGPSRLVWAIALPAMLTNVATALFGLADMWVIGRLGDASAQGAVELGAKFLTGLLVTFNFLRTGTVALTAQSAGSGDSEERAATLARGMAAAIAIGVVLMLLKPLAISAGLALLEAKGEVAANAEVYVGIRYWATTAWLINCVLIGWLIGQRRVRTVLAIEVIANVVHIALDLTLVLLLGWGVAGVAVATVSSELLKLAIVAIIVAAEPAARQAEASVLHAATWRWQALRRLFALNRDLFLRTLLLTAAMMILARSGAQQGPVILAANGILFQLFMLSTLILDGFENAAQVLCGEARGATDRDRFRSALRANLKWGWVVGAVISLVYLAVGGHLAMSFSTDPQVAQTARSYAAWIVLLPIVGVTSFVLDGVYVGAAWTRSMLASMAIAFVAYVGLLFLSVPLGNHGLWLAFSMFFLVRAAGQLVFMPRLIRRDFSGPANIEAAAVSSQPN